MTLKEALAWLTSHHQLLAALRGQGLVVKVGGSVQDDPATMKSIARDVACLVTLGARPVVVHGGGKAITAAMAKAGLEARFVEGQRYTDETTLAIVEKVLVNTVNRELVEFIEDEGAQAQGLHSMGQCVLQAERTGTDATAGKPSEDLGLVGRVTRVNAPVILGLCEAGVVPVIAPVAQNAVATPGVPKFNVNADLAAGTVAAALRAAAFVLISDTPGVRMGADAASIAATLTAAQYEAAVRSGEIAGGMIPKLSACFEALRGKVERVSIVDGRVPHALLAAVLSAEGEAIPGTRVKL